MKKIILGLLFCILFLPLPAKALIFFPTGNLVILVNSDQDGLFEYQLKDGFYPYDVVDTFPVQTVGGSGSYTYESFAGFPNRFRQVPVTGMDLSVSCVSVLGSSQVLVVQNEVRFALGDSDTVTCTFTNTLPNRKNKLLIIPGIMGTEMFKGEEKLWADSTRMLITPNDRFMDPLAYDANGSPIDFSVIPNKMLTREATFDYSETLISDLHSLGYLDEQDLFLFPYDWRKELGSTANSELKAKLDALLAQAGQDKIDVIAHSQGGLLIKKLLLDHPSYLNKIDKLIFLGTPHLGAPKAAKALLYGDNMGVSFLKMGLDPQEIKRIGAHMPSVYELLPSREYFSRVGGYLGTATKDGIFAPWQMQIYDRAQTNASLASAGLNMGLVHEADAFHSPALDNFDFSGSEIKAYNIVGCQQATISRIFQKPDGKFVLDYSAGDVTVPVKSANHLFGVKAYYALETEHGTMMTDDGVRQQILNLLNGSETIASEGKLALDASACRFEGEVVSVHSPVSISVLDEDGNLTGKTTDGGIVVDIPQSQYDEIGEEKFIVLPRGKKYTVRLQGLGDGSFSLYRKILQDDQVVSSETFVGLPVSSTLQGELVLDGDSSSFLRLDDDGDGDFEKTLSPNILSLEQVGDIAPPQTALSFSGSFGEVGFFRSDVVASLTAVDQAQAGVVPSGVLQTKWRVKRPLSLEFDSWVATDENNHLVFSQEGQYVLEYYSVDLAGNTEPFQTTSFTIDKTAPEARMYFDIHTKDLAVESLEDNTSVLYLEEVVKLTDRAGNFTELGFAQKNRKKAFAGELVFLSYNGSEWSPMKNKFKTTWQLDKAGQLKTMSQTVISKNNFKVEAVFKDGITKLKGEDGLGKFENVLAGLKVLSVETAEGAFRWRVLP